MELPLFPLPNLVLFPGIILPLHIFEPRYQLMINECLDRNEPFGLVQLRNGADTESESTIHRVGVSAHVVQVERLEGGRMNILIEGEARFRVLRFLGQTPYWKGSIDFFEDETEAESVVKPFYDELVSVYRRAFELGIKLGSVAESELALPESPEELSYMVAYVLEIEPEEKQRLLEMTSTAERLSELVQYCQDTIGKLEKQVLQRETSTKVRGNGDLGKPHARG
jgi:Lon protease-like protein